MPALKPLPSLARVNANRQNAQHSTGPRTEVGKSRSRANAVRHGLTGAGIALPAEDEAVVTERFGALQAELAPQSTLGACLVHQIAVATVRTQRAVRQESAALATRVRHAAEEFDRARHQTADLALARLATEPTAARRELLAMPEGVDRLVQTLLDLRDRVKQPVSAWTGDQDARLEVICGRLPGQTHSWAGRPYSRAVLGDPSLLTERDRAEARKFPVLTVWAAAMLARIIDEEVAKLLKHRESLDHAAIALDRAEAADRALFDPSADATRARRYEASATRDLFRALAHLRVVEAQSPASLTPPVPVPTFVPEPMAVAVARPVPTPAVVPSSPAPSASRPLVPSPGTASAPPRGGREAIKEIDLVAPNSLPNKRLDGLLGSFGNPPVTDLSQVSAGRRVG